MGIHASLRKNKHYFALSLILLLSFSFYEFIKVENQQLENEVKSDFEKIHPDAELINWSVGEGDLSAAYVTIQYLSPNDIYPQEENWQYLKVDNKWSLKRKSSP